MKINDIHGKIDAIKFMRSLFLAHPLDSELSEEQARELQSYSLGLNEAKDIVERIQSVTPPPINPGFDYNNARENMYKALDLLNATVAFPCRDLSMHNATRLTQDIEKAGKSVSKVLKTLEDLRAY